MGRLYKILVADDEPTIRTAIASYLKNFNFKVVEAVDGEEAKNALSGNDIDLVITDVNMPRFSGL